MSKLVKAQTADVFKRYEKKYMLTRQQYEELRSFLEGKMTVDAYGRHTICNVYYDTSDFQLIRTSIEKPIYKEKVRLRSYGIPDLSTITYLELKKKFDGIVYKRRIALPLSDAVNYLHNDRYPHGQDCQILRELNFALGKYDLIPQVYLSYERIALFGNEDENLRITFDERILCRHCDLHLDHGSYGIPLLDPQQILMEIKIPEVMPMWLSRILSRLGIYPCSFSKYGTYYKEYLANCALENDRKNKGGVHCA